MKGKEGKKAAVVAVLVTSVWLTGCATDSTISISEDTDKENYDKVTAYAAELLMKHSYNLVDDLTCVTIKNSDKASSEDSSAGASMFADTAGTNTENGIQNNSAAGTDVSNIAGSADSAGMTDVAQANNSASGMSSQTNNGSQASSAEPGGTDAAASSSAQTASSSMSIQDALSGELNGLDLMYNGYSVMNAYPTMNAQGGVTAGNGKKLLVLNFTLANNTADKVQMDMLGKNTSFRVSVNGDDVGYISVTMLEDDLSNFEGSIAASSQEDVVLVVEVPESTAGSIQSISLTIELNGKNYNVGLQ